MRCSLVASVVVGLSVFPFLGSCAPCDEANPCTEGCCSKLSDVCGYGPSYCASDVCIPEASQDGSCKQKSECDPGGYPGWGESWGTYLFAFEAEFHAAHPSSFPMHGDNGSGNLQ